MQPATLSQLAARELATRELEKRYAPERQSLMKFIKLYYKEELNKTFDENRHYDVIEEKLLEIVSGKCTRLMINIPPGSGKTIMITKFFPVRWLGHQNDLQVIATGYSSDLTQGFSGEARDIYNSKTYKKVFPRSFPLKSDKNTRQLWGNDRGSQYFATGTDGSITGNRCKLFLIDDPIKPNQAESDTIRIGVNNWYDNTVLSRLFNPLTDAVIIIMQRTHDNDLCGYLMEREKKGLGEKRDKIILPAIAQEDDQYRKKGEPLQYNRFPLEALEQLRKGLGPANFSSQYLQNPTNKESQEFHEEWFRYYDVSPKGGRVFTTCDPAFSKKKKSDYSCVMTAQFTDDKMYILEYTVGKFDPGELIDKIVYHAKKRSPEKIGVEAVAAQMVLGVGLRNKLSKEGISCIVDDIRQNGEKETKIRKLIALYRDGLIYHKPGYADLEDQLVRFPRGSHDDIIDAEQMLYDMYELMPNTPSLVSKVQVNYDSRGRPVVSSSDNDWL